MGLKPLRALGLMSGTSLDGVDAAELVTDGVAITEFGRTAFAPYPEGKRALIRQGLGTWPETAPALGARIGEAVDAGHGAIATEFPESELIGYHGQTLNHAPGQGRTYQAGDGAALARISGRPVVWDFRSADVASGGEGAPLVPVFHFALARYLGLSRPVAFLNIGGVANVTWVDPSRDRPEDLGALVAFDTGPGNALIDDLMRERTGADRDEAGGLASRGQVDERLLDAWMGHAYFDRPAPKSLDRNAFHACLEDVAAMADADAAATLTEFTARAVAASVRHMPQPPERWLVCGGGRLNRTLMACLARRTNVATETVEAVGLDGDMLEAQAFAYLAVRVRNGLPTSFPSTTAARLPVCGGRISFPDGS